jgi:mRNA interferase MazF
MTSSKRAPVEASRGEVWRVDLNPTRGPEQAGVRPALVVSENTFNHGPAELLIVLPITGTGRGIPFHVQVKPPEGGLNKVSYIKCEEPRCISKSRLMDRLGTVKQKTIEDVEDRLKIVLDLA